MSKLFQDALQKQRLMPKFQMLVWMCASVLALFAAPVLADAKSVSEAKTTAASVPKPAAPTAEITLDVFLDRLMMSESGGRLNARNNRSTAVGPFQFIASTWLQIARTSFAIETADLKPHEVLELRTDLNFARRAAKIYTEANAAHLAANDHKPTFGNLRLAFLVGPAGAVRVLSAKAETPVVALLGATVVGANPFMRQMTAADLIARAQRDISAEASVDTGLTPSPDAIANAKGKPKYARQNVSVRCNLSRPSCRKFVALAERKAARPKRVSRN